MDTSIVPVTEAEMRGIAERLISTVVGYSRQAGELADLREQVNSLASQLSTIRADNSTLRGERDEALQLAVENEAKLNDARRHRDELERRVGTLNETMIARDNRVRELEGLLTSAKLDAEDWQRKHAYADRVSEDLRNQLSTVRERRDHWMVRAEDAEKALAEANDKLQALEKQVSDIFGLVKSKAPEPIAEVVPVPPQAVEVPATPPDPQQAGETGQPSPQSEVASFEASTKPWWEVSKAAE